MAFLFFDEVIADILKLCDAKPDDARPFGTLRGMLAHADYNIRDAAAIAMAKLTCNLHGGRLEACLAASMPDALLANGTEDAIAALTRICRHSKDACLRLLRGTKLATALPDLLTGRRQRGLELVLQLASHEHSQEQMWLWLEPSACAFYRCASRYASAHVLSVLQWLAASPRIAAHMVRNNVSNIVQLI